MTAHAPIDAALLGGLFPHGYVRMVLKDLAIPLRVGVHAGERGVTQRVLITAEMFAEDPGRGPENGLESVVNYDSVYRQIRAWSERPHVDLLETLLEELAALCFDNPRVRACRVAIMKPDVFPEAAEAGVELFRIRK